MKKRNLLLAVMAAFTLSGCMLIQTEKVYKSAEELPDDPIERMKASVSLCKYAGADSSICKDNIVYPSHTGYFYSIKYEGGDFSYLKRSDYNRLVDASIIAERACKRSSIARYCAVSGNLEKSQGLGIVSKINFFMEACELGDIKSCGRVMSDAQNFRRIAESTYKEDEKEFKFTGFDRANFRYMFGSRKKVYDYGKKMFYDAREKFRKLYRTDVWGQRVNRLKDYVYAPKSGESLNSHGYIETYSSMNKEAVNMIIEMCNLNQVEFCFRHLENEYKPFPLSISPENLVIDYEDDVLKTGFNFNAYNKKLEDLANMEQHRVILNKDERIRENMMKKMLHLYEIVDYMY